MRTIRKIVHPTDFSKGAEPALELAIEMARTFSAELTILYVYATPVHMGPLGDGYALPLDLVQKLQGDAERALEQLSQRTAKTGIRIHTLAIEGIASETIVATAEKRGMDLIVMGTHGRTGLKHLLLGSVAERVVRAAPCPVLTVRAAFDRKPD